MRQIRHRGGGSFHVNAEKVDTLEIRHRVDPVHGCRYEAFAADDPVNPVAHLGYIKDFPVRGVITFHELFVDPQHQGSGVALEMCFRLHADTPGYSYDPGPLSADGADFARRVLASEPHADGLWHQARPRPDDEGGQECTK